MINKKFYNLKLTGFELQQLACFLNEFCFAAAEEGSGYNKEDIDLADNITDRLDELEGRKPHKHERRFISDEDVTYQKDLEYKC